MPSAKSAAATPGSLRPSGLSRRTVAALPLPSAPIAAPPRRSQSSSLRSAGLPVPTTIRRSRLVPAGASRSRMLIALPLKPAAEAARSTSASTPRALASGPSLRSSPAKAIAVPESFRPGLEKDTATGLDIDCLCRGLGAPHRLRDLGEGSGGAPLFPSGRPKASTTPARNRANLRRRRPLRRAAQAS